MPTYGTFKWDLVDGARVRKTAAVGQINRIARFYGVLPSGSTSDPGALLKALEDDGCPLLGDSFPRTGYEDWLLKGYEVFPRRAGMYDIDFTYIWNGLLYIKDTSSLSTVSTQLHPETHKPLYVKWKNPDDPNSQKITKLLNLNTFLPLRHLIASQTITYLASGDVLAAFPSVNDNTWKGLPKGYWLFSALEGETTDGGITYTYSVTISTKQKEDWSQLGFLQDDQGKAITVPESKVIALRSKPYAYSLDDSVDGLLKVGLIPMLNFSTLFGF